LGVRLSECRILAARPGTSFISSTRISIALVAEHAERQGGGLLGGRVVGRQGLHDRIEAEVRMSRGRTRPIASTPNPRCRRRARSAPRSGRGGSRSSTSSALTRSVTTAPSRHRAPRPVRWRPT
jgi:hypothetical protein